MISGGERGREIHLPDYIPTMLADESYFGTDFIKRNWIYNTDKI